MNRVVMALVLTLGLIVPIAGAVPASAAGTIVVQIDNPTSGEQNMSPAWLAGWAVDTASMGGTGITSVAIYMDGDMSTGTLLGQANYGGDRPDVAAVFGSENFRYSGWTMPLDNLNIPMGPHTFTAVAYSPNAYAEASVANVTLAPTRSQVAAYPYSGSSSQTGLPQIGSDYPGQPAPATPSTNQTYQSNGLQVSATLSNVQFVAGQDYYNMLPNFNGYAYQGLVLPNGTVLNTGTPFNNGQLMYNGSFVPVTSYISPVTLQPVSVPSTSYSYNTVLPDGTVVPTASGPMGYGMGSFWSNNYLTPGYGFQPGLQQVSPGMSAVNNPNNPLSDNVILYRPYNNGFQATITLPQPSVFGNGFTYSNFNFNGNAAMQATLVARVTTPDGNPVQGATVTYNGYQLQPTDGNGITTGTVLFPITTGQELNGTVHAEFNGMTADVPLVLNYTMP